MILNVLLNQSYIEFKRICSNDQSLFELESKAAAVLYFELNLTYWIEHGSLRVVLWQRMIEEKANDLQVAINWWSSQSAVWKSAEIFIDPKSTLFYLKITCLVSHSILRFVCINVSINKICWAYCQTHTTILPNNSNNNNNNSTKWFQWIKTFLISCSNTQHTYIYRLNIIQIFKYKYTHQIKLPPLFLFIVQFFHVHSIY